MLVKYNVTEMKHTFNRSFPCISYLFNIVAVFGKRRVFLRKQTIGQHLISNAMQSPTPSWQRLLYIATYNAFMPFTHIVTAISTVQYATLTTKKSVIKNCTVMQ